MKIIERLETVPEALCGRRLDQAAASLFPEYSRTRLQRWIREGQLRVNGEPGQPRATVTVGDRLSLRAETEVEGEWQAADIAFPIRYEDEDILVIDKPPGLVMHPAAGHRDDTLLNGLLSHCPALAEVPRAGIVHRLDRDTSGLLVVAKTIPVQTRLVKAIQKREVRREYLALVNGLLVSGGTVDKPIGRHPKDRQRMAVLSAGGKAAVTHYRVRERFRAHTLLRVLLETGRTHQIRVHMASIGHPIVGDPVYGGRPRLPREAGTALTEALRGFRRQALHAWRLAFAHPDDGREMEFESPLPVDMQALIAALRDDARGHPDVG